MCVCERERQRGHCYDLVYSEYREDNGKFIPLFLVGYKVKERQTDRVKKSTSMSQIKVLRNIYRQSPIFVLLTKNFLLVILCKYGNFSSFLGKYTIRDLEDCRVSILF